jgi:hypothetical protein
MDEAQDVGLGCIVVVVVVGDVGSSSALGEWTRELGDSKRETAPNYTGSRTRHRRSNNTKQASQVPRHKDRRTDSSGRAQ